MRIINHGLHGLASLTLACLTILRCASAATWYVDAANGNDENAGTSWGESLATIQSAVDKATSGDEILVNDGTYSSFKLSRGSYQSVTWLKVAVRSMSGPYKTIIDGGQVRLGEGYYSTYDTMLTGASIEGFTIKGGAYSVYGSGEIKRCILTDVHGEQVVKCCIVNNSIFYANEVSGPEIGNARLYNCTIYENHGKYIAYDSSGSALYNCIYYGNNLGVYDGAGGAWRNYAYNCFSADPKFVDLEGGDFRLLPTSPCIDAGNNSYAASDDTDVAGKPRINGSTVDIGAYEYYPVELSLKGITAKQRYPWNGKVDVQFKLETSDSNNCVVMLFAKDVAGGTNLPMRTVYKFDGSAVNVSGELVSHGTHHWVWDAAADVPDGFECDRVMVEVKASDPEPLYMVIDLSSGDKTYLADVPNGGWTDEYKTSKMVLRKIYKGTNPAGGAMTNDMWVGIFEITQGQMKTLGVECGDSINHDLSFSGQEGGVGDCKPLNCSEIRCNDHYYEHSFLFVERGLSTNKDGTKLGSTLAIPYYISRFKAVTGLTRTRLPSVPEWQYVYRAGTATDFYGYPVSGIATYDSGPRGRAAENTSGLTDVGIHAPNAWGLYDMSGNAGELTSYVWVGQYASWSVCYGGCFNSHEDECSVNSNGWPEYSLNVSGAHYHYLSGRIFVEAE